MKQPPERVDMGRLVTGLFSVVCLLACGGGPQPVPPGPDTPPDPAPTASEAPSSPLPVTFAQFDFSKNPELLARIAATPYGFYRFTNVAFADRVCTLFKGALTRMPRVNLHGDAHLEQYAVTPGGRGLADFDDTCTGPAVIDLVRFGTAIALAHHTRKWGNTHATVEAFFDGYRAALADPEVTREEPGFVRRVRSQFNGDRLAFLKWAETLMQPMEPAEEARLRGGHALYTREMAESSGLTEGYFVLKSVGGLRLGFGSALDRKYLLRVEGPTEAPEDDVILEAKEVRDLSGIRCIQSAHGGGALRILVGKARITESPQPFLAEMPHQPGDEPERAFWVHAWVDNYVELDIQKTLLSPEELRVIAFDVGAQLGRGHTLKIASPFDAQLRRAQLRVMERHEDRIHEAIEEMTTATVAGWQRFVDDARKAGALPSEAATASP